ncbi:MAG: hypothetical protein RSD99_31935, partial [Janthinobacterium sp.]
DGFQVGGDGLGRIDGHGDFFCEGKWKRYCSAFAVPVNMRPVNSRDAPGRAEAGRPCGQACDLSERRSLAALR